MEYGTRIQYAKTNVAVYVYKKRATSLIREIEAGENGLPAYTYGGRRASSIEKARKKMRREEEEMKTLQRQTKTHNRRS